MNIPALLIEYLITGGFAVVWIVPLILLFEIDPTTGLYKSYIVLIGIPVLYVLGLILDMFCGLVTHKTKAKRIIRKEVKRDFIEKHGEIEDDSSASIYIRLHNNDLANEFEKRSSRDRIARGATLNLAIASILIPFAFDSKLYEAVFQFSLLCSLTYSSFHIWKVCEKRSYSFKLKAFNIVCKEFGNPNKSLKQDK